MMIAIIKGDVINSRKIEDPRVWLVPFKKLLSQWGREPMDWDIAWGDSFQIRIEDPRLVMDRVIRLKTFFKTICQTRTPKKSSILDVRVGIGISSEHYQAPRVFESNGEAYIMANEAFEALGNKKRSIFFRTDWPDFDSQMNLYAQFLQIIVEDWTLSSAELMEIVLDNQQMTQAEIGQMLGIRQNSVSGRWQRAHVDAIVELQSLFPKMLAQQWS